MLRLNKLIARAGIASRRAADELIRQGRVRVNGRPVVTPGVVVDEETDRVAVDGRDLTLKSAEPVWILLNKPAGYVSSLKDERGRAVVTDLVPGRGRLFPVGRLDRDTTGVLLLTDDGDLAARLTHPRHGVAKVYEATIDKPLGEPDLLRLAGGVTLDDGCQTSPATVRQQRRAGGTVVRIVLHEGRKRQVRRMLAAVGRECLALRRISFAGLTARGVPLGGYRFLTRKEIDALDRGAGSG